MSKSKNWLQRFFGSPSAEDINHANYRKAKAARSYLLANFRKAYPQYRDQARWHKTSHGWKLVLSKIPAKDARALSSDHRFSQVLKISVNPEPTPNKAKVVGRDRETGAYLVVTDQAGSFHCPICDKHLQARVWGKIGTCNKCKCIIKTVEPKTT